MTIAEQIQKTFEDNLWEWNFSTGYRIPSVEDVEGVLDEAAKVLYDEPVGAQLEIGRLIIRKLAIGHDVYIYSGQYL